MQSHFKRILKIASNILADIHFNNKEEFDEYLKNHPGYRENTKFFVDGIQIKPPSKKKKEHPKEGVSERQKYVDDWTNTIQSSTPAVLVNPYDNPDKVSFNDTYVLSYGDKKTIFKPTTKKDASVRKSVNTRQVSASRREVISFELSEKLGIGIVPPTYLTNRVVPINSKNYKREGSEQAFVKGKTWGHKCVEDGDKIKDTIKKPKVQKGLGMMSVADYLFGSADRHNENLMIDDDDNLYAIDNGLTFAVNGYFDEKDKCGDYCSLPTDILFRMNEDYDTEYSLGKMKYDQLNRADYNTDFEQFMKLEVIKDAGGYHPEVEKFFQEMDYDKAEQTITEVMQHYGMDEKSTKDTISRLRDIQGLFNY